MLIRRYPARQPDHRISAAHIAPVSVTQVTDEEPGGCWVQAQAPSRPLPAACPRARQGANRSTAHLQDGPGADWSCSDGPECSTARGSASATAPAREIPPSQMPPETSLDRGDLLWRHANDPGWRKSVGRSM